MQKKAPHKSVLAKIQGPFVEQSDYILIVVEHLSHLKQYDKFKRQLQNIITAYHKNNYDDAIQQLNQLANALLPSIADRLIAISHGLPNTPSRAYSRRFYQHQLLIYMKSHYPDKIYASMQKLLDFTVFYSNTDANENMTVSNSNDVNQAFILIKRYMKSQTRFVNLLEDLRVRSDMYAKKCRSTRSTEDGSSPHFLSTAPSIVLARQPMDWTARQDVQRNRHVDSFEIDHAVAGLSADRPDIPFVNSVSGTTYTVALSLSLYIQHYLANNPDSSHLHEDIGHVLFAFIVTCLDQGWHSIEEIQVVLHDRVVVDLCEQYGFDTRHIDFPADAINEAFQAAMKYSAQLHGNYSCMLELSLHSQSLTCTSNASSDSSCENGSSSAKRNCR